MRLAPEFSRLAQAKVDGAAPPRSREPPGPKASTRRGGLERQNEVVKDEKGLGR